MIVLLLLGLLLLGTAVVLVTRGVIDARLRTMDTLGQIGHYGFAGTVELEPHPGFRGFLDSAASSVGVLLTEKVNIISEDRMHRTMRLPPRAFSARVARGCASVLIVAAAGCAHPKSADCCCRAE